MSEEERDTGRRGKGVSKRRLWLFRLLAAVVGPILLLVLMELVLRLGGYGFATSAIIECEVDGVKAYCDNAQFGWHFFPKSMAREFNRFVFPAKKAGNAYRIFIFGASTAQGTPAGEYSFGRILEVMLRDRYPGVDFQVITVAMPAINSHGALMIAKDCSRYEPDLFIVYLGNNEVVGPYGAGTVLDPLARSLPLIRAKIFMKATRLGQLLRNVAEAHDGDGMNRAWGGLEMFLDEQVRADSDDLQVVRSHFRKNLADIVRVARGCEADIIVSTVGCNLKDSPPFASQHRGDLAEADQTKWEQLYAEGIGYEEAGEYGEAVRLYLSAAEIDDAYADLHFRLGRCYWNMGEYAQARERYIRARELDTLRFRADNGINEVIREVAGDKEDDRVYLLDAEKLFRSHSPHDMPGSEFFYEHVHLKFGGNYLLAGAMLEKMEALLPEAIRGEREAERPQSSERECARRLAYTGWDRHKLAGKVINTFIKKPPFTNQLYQEERLTSLQGQLDRLEGYLEESELALCQEQYLQAIEQDPEDWWLHWKYAELLKDGLKKPRDAVEHYRMVTELTPESYVAHTAYGLALVEIGQLDAAAESGLRALRLNPYCAHAYHVLGIVKARKGQHDEAIRFFAEEVKKRPDRAQGYNQMGIVLAKQGKPGKAEEVYRDGLGFSPDNVALHYNLALILAKQKRYDEALTELAAIPESSPNIANIRELTEDFRKAGEDMQEAQGRGDEGDAEGGGLGAGQD